MKVETGLNIFDHKFLRRALDSLPKKVAVITDTHIHQFYGEAFFKALCEGGKDCAYFVIPSGEQFKTRETKQQLEDDLFAKGLRRDTLIIAFGGGVVSDLAGFVASTFCRGVPLILVPTSLTGMVDAAIGGKTAVNLPFGKNLLGTFYQPQATWIDASLLQTLPKDQLKSGLIEVIKHGLIADEPFFCGLKQHMGALVDLNRPLVEQTLEVAIRIKENIIAQDPYERGKRRVLNFGHTIGHAIEKTNFYEVLHGEAVALGILAESFLSYVLGFLSFEELERIKDTILGLRLRLSHIRLDEQGLFEAMNFDKKSCDGQPRFVLLEKIGKPKAFNGIYCSEVDPALIKDSFFWIKDVMRSH
ncbi:MAG: 3-dehydroquinate synthase [Parachlamydiaceae bacterium]